MPIPNDRTRADVQCSCWNGLAHAKISLVDSKAFVSGVALDNEVSEELCSICIGDECLELKNNLDDAVEDRKDEVDLREPGESDTVPL